MQPRWSSRNAFLSPGVRMYSGYMARYSSASIAKLAKKFL